MASRDEFEPLRGALAEALGGLARRGAPIALQPLWSTAAGPAAAGASRPVEFHGGTLIVEVDSPAWLGGLQQQEAELKARLARLVPGFRTLELRLKWGKR